MVSKRFLIIAVIMLAIACVNYAQGVLLKQQIVSESGEVLKSEIITGYITINISDNLIVINKDGSEQRLEKVGWWDFESSKWGVDSLTFAFVMIGDMRRDILWSPEEGWLAHTAGVDRWLKYYYHVDNPPKEKALTEDEKHPDPPKGGWRLIYYMGQETKDYFSKKYDLDFNDMSTISQIDEKYEAYQKKKKAKNQSSK